MLLWCLLGWGLCGFLLFAYFTLEPVWNKSTDREWRGFYTELGCAIVATLLGPICAIGLLWVRYIDRNL